MKPYWASQCFTINSKNKNLNSDYLYYLSKYSLETKFMSSKKGGGQPYIRGSQFINHKIPLPSLEVQQQIVDELTLVEESTTTIQTRLDQLKREKEQYRKYGKKAEIRALLEGSESKMLGDVCEINGGKGINERSKEQTIENNIPYYDSNGVKGYVSESLYEGEYIITARKLSIGSVHYHKGKYYSSDNTINITSKNTDNMLNLYIFYWFKYNNHILINMSSGIKPGVRITDVRKLSMKNPSLEIQEQCITLFEQKEAYIESIDKKIAEHKNYLEELKALAKDVITSFC